MKTEKLIFTYIVKFTRQGRLVTSYLISATSLFDAKEIARHDQGQSHLNDCAYRVYRLKHEQLNDYAY